MRRLLPLLLAPLLLLGLIPTQASAAARAGGACTKVGATTKVGKTTLKCAANKKWAAVAAPKPKPTTTTISQPTPTPTPTPTPVGVRVALTESCHAKGNATLQRRVSGTWSDLAAAQGWDVTAGCSDPTAYRPWTTADVKEGDVLRWRVYGSTFEWFSSIFTYRPPIKPYAAVTAPDKAITDYSTVAVLARDSIWSMPKSDTPNKVTMEAESTIAPAVKDALFAAGEYSMKYFAPLLPKTMVFRILTFSTRDWGLKSAIAYDPTNKKFTDDMERTFPNWGKGTATNCSGGGGFSVGYLEDPLLVLDHPCQQPSEGLFLVAHEFAHSVQAKYSQTENPGCVSPKWFVEGQAQVFGAALSYNKGNAWVPARANMTSYQEKPYKAIMKEMEPDTLRNQEYHNGMLMMEYLIARSGWQKSLDILLEASRLADRGCLRPGDPVMQGFDTAFKNVYGQSVSAFYDEVYPYLEWAYANKGK
jgi:hypothetical protein